MTSNSLQYHNIMANSRQPETSDLCYFTYNQKSQPGAGVWSDSSDTHQGTHIPHQGTCVQFSAPALAPDSSFQQNGIQQTMGGAMTAHVTGSL